MHGGLVRGRYMHGGLVDITSNRLVFVEAEGCAGEAAASSDSTQPLPVVTLLNPSRVLVEPEGGAGEGGADGYEGASSWPVGRCRPTSPLFRPPPLCEALKPLSPTPRTSTVNSHPKDA